ncbi:MAG: hypothetical protein FWF79_02280 [Defluviitaleaceae bacterium]|nr:hypothetical protein [Defluviitaleaceae bacterium]
MSKRKIITVVILSLTLLFVGASPVFAEAEYEGMEAIAITVIIPPVPERQAPAPAARRVFPVNVAEGYNYEGVRELVRIYELLPGESPEWINTDSFQRNGYYYQLAEIIRRVDVSHTVREHREVVKIPSPTNNLQAVIAGLYPTMEFVDEDGYTGLLHLDIRSIEMTQDGTRSTSRTVSQTREYPHLSNPDISLIPQTVSANGRTYTLSDVNWRTNTATPIDFNSVAQTFTAVATYTRTATSNVSTGYTTIAEYSGMLTRVSTGEVRFAATFIGTPIVSPIVNRPAQNAGGETLACADSANGLAAVNADTPQPNITGNGGNGYNGSNGNNGSNASINGNGSNGGYNPQITTEAESTQDSNAITGFGGIPFLPLVLALAGAGIIFALFVLMLKFKKRADMLEQKSYEDSGDALYSRMATIIHNDRKELAGHSDEYADAEYEPSELYESGEDSNFEGFVSGYHNSDEDGDENV